MKITNVLYFKNRSHRAHAGYARVVLLCPHTGQSSGAGCLSSPVQSSPVHSRFFFCNLLYVVLVLQSGWSG